ncbi:glycerophosphodiester phosphodiesterase [Tenuibacillus multivorans]|uniref:Glycerophosphoryl diester phosphodiesterase n=1 Tax=Tenuibacillus multivorans TaxID=237069 RepID=A0A1G9YG05_9BACI|nr:glycerophosphodiester phosphodiesterase [Tenuibacillus multivorans]GEL78531.1 glycerophosphoryl diester phosphodiesterase [Tenuibacillus multivorans]SDN07947.1 glycerophosphoryl diester phosphodiesterase [Tenuibacillus multivorans]
MKRALVKYIIIIVAIYIFAFWLLFLRPQPTVEQKQFLENEKEGPLVIAHRAGDMIAPGNTMTAIEKSADIGVDIIEVDIHITKDGHLVLMHDPSVDRTTDGSGLVSEFTLEEFLMLDAGFHFLDINGEYSFRGLGVYKPTLREVFERYPNMKYMLEIKHTNPPELYDEIAAKLWELIKEFNMHDRVMVASFDQEVIDQFNQLANGRVALGTGEQSAFNFVITHKLFARNLFRPTGHALQLPLKNRYFQFLSEDIIEGAQRLGMDVHYWTVNDEESMRKLIDAGVDGIITDRPDLLIDILEEKGLR